MPPSPSTSTTTLTTMLDVPSVSCSLPRVGVAIDRVFDAWAWCESDVLEWRRPATFPPRELARFHAKGYGLDEEWALAPYAIDDATDLLYEKRVRPRDVFWVGASSLRALVWGLHDWAHFHNHGPFDEPALTELACDLVASSWLLENRDAIGLEDGDLARVALELASLSRARFEAEGKPSPTSDLDGLFASAIAGELARQS